MAKKYYAVARGKTPGIYFTWEDCKTQVQQFSGAVYKSFPTLQEAEQFIEKVNETGMQGNVPVSSDDIRNTEEVQPVSTKQHLIAYVDGSYEQSRKRYAYGCALVLPEEVVTLNGSGDDEDYVGMRNVAGEILGSEQAINWAVEHGYQQITI